MFIFHVFVISTRLVVVMYIHMHYNYHYLFKKLKQLTFEYHIHSDTHIIKIIPKTMLRIFFCIVICVSCAVLTSCNCIDDLIVFIKKIIDTKCIYVDIKNALDSGPKVGSDYRMSKKLLL